MCAHLVMEETLAKVSEKLYRVEYCRENVEKWHCKCAACEATKVATARLKRRTKQYKKSLPVITRKLVMKIWCASITHKGRRKELSPKLSPSCEGRIVKSCIWAVPSIQLYYKRGHVWCFIRKGYCINARVLLVQFSQTSWCDPLRWCNRTMFCQLTGGSKSVYCFASLSSPGTLTRAYVQRAAFGGIGSLLLSVQIFSVALVLGKAPQHILTLILFNFVAVL